MTAAGHAHLRQRPAAVAAQNRPQRKSRLAASTTWTMTFRSSFKNSCCLSIFFNNCFCDLAGQKMKNVSLVFALEILVLIGLVIWIGIHAYRLLKLRLAKGKSNDQSGGHHQ